MNDWIIGIAGAGTMGSGIAQQAAMAGHTVLLYDSLPQAVEKARTSIHTSLAKLEEKSRINNAAQILQRIQCISSPEQFSPASFIIEAIVEDLPSKQQLYQQLETVITDDCLLATNTSSLPIASLASVCRHPERFIGVHFFNPPVLMPLVEIIPGIKTSDKTLQKTISLIQSWNKTTITVRDTPGFLVNRIARPFYGEALRILDEGMATCTVIDQAMKSLGGFKMGPFELMDFIGIDVNYKVTESIWQQMFYDARYRPSHTQKRMVEAGILGRKTGRGFYEYVDGKAIVSPADAHPQKLEYIFHRILFMLINEAAETLYYGIATADDIEKAMTLGVHYPRGLLHWADDIGIETIYRFLLQLHHTYCEERYRPCVLLKEKAESGQSFF
jgi:3-hydroxybutyryl-CoA dehydrogenase